MGRIHYIIIGLFLVAGWSFQVQGQTKDTIINDDDLYDVAEIVPEFPGGDKACQKFLMENIKYPKTIGNGGIEGRVVVSFVVEIDGSITNIEVVRSVYKLLDEEAVRVIKLMPKWKPGEVNDKPVRARFRLPVTFTLQ